MKRQLFASAGGIILVATAAKVITIPAVAQTIRAAFVKNIDEKGRNPYSQSLYCTNFNANNCEVTFPDVPAGMRLVVENINVVVAGERPLNGAQIVFRNRDNSMVHPFAADYAFETYLQKYFLNVNLTEFVDAGPGPLIEIYAVVSNGEILGSNLQADL